MDVGADEARSRTTRTSRRTRARRSAASGDPDAAARRSARPRRPRRQALLELASTNLGVAGREPHGRRRASSRAAARPSPTARCSATSCSTSRCRRARRSRRRRRRRSRSRSASTSSSARTRRGSTSRTRSPASTPTSTTSASRGWCTAASCVRRGQGAYGDGTSQKPSVASTRARSSTSRASQVVRAGDFLGVVAPTEYDAIQAAAQLKVKWAETRRCCRGREPLEADARPRRGRQGAGARSRANTGNVDTAFASAATDGLADLQVPRTTATLPIGPSVRVADVTHGRRASSSRTRRTPASTCGTADRRRRSGCRPRNRIRRHLLRGRELVRRGRSAVRHAPGGGDHVAARRQAGAPPADALGRARLGQLRRRRS